MEGLRERQPAMAGVTLLEIVVAMTILALIAGGTLGAFVFGRQVMQRSNVRADAVRYAQQTLEELRLAVRLATPPGLSYTHPDDPALARPDKVPNLRAGTNKLHELPEGVFKKRFQGTRTYTVEHGRFQPDGTIQWTGTDDDHDITKVTVTVQHVTPDG